jgi:hypothetical protein
MINLGQFSAMKCPFARAEADEMKRELLTPV